MSEPSIGIGMRIVLGVGLAAELAVFALAVFGLWRADDPFSLQLAPAWMIAILFGLLNLRLAALAVGFLRRGAMTFARIDANGIANLRDAIGPIAWSDIRGASIRALPPVFRISSRSALFIEVPVEVARLHLRRSSWLMRPLTRPRSNNGLAQIEVMARPPHTDDDLREVLEKIRALARLV